MQARDSTSEVKLPPSDCSRLHQYSAEQGARRGGPGGWISRSAEGTDDGAERRRLKRGCGGGGGGTCLIPWMFLMA